MAARASETAVGAGGGVPGGDAGPAEGGVAEGLALVPAAGLVRPPAADGVARHVPVAHLPLHTHAHTHTLAPPARVPSPSSAGPGGGLGCTGGPLGAAPPCEGLSESRGGISVPRGRPAASTLAISLPVRLSLVLSIPLLSLALPVSAVHFLPFSLSLSVFLSLSLSPAAPAAAAAAAAAALTATARSCMAPAAASAKCVRASSCAAAAAAA